MEWNTDHTNLFNRELNTEFKIVVLIKKNWGLAIVAMIAPRARIDIWSNRIYLLNTHIPNNEYQAVACN